MKSLRLCPWALGIVALAPGVCAQQSAPPQIAPAAVSPSTRALYSYRRNDASTDGVTTVHINAAHTGATPLSPDVFGNFIENLGTVIYDSLWADTLHNPNLELIDGSDREEQWWDQTGAATWQSNDNAGYLSPRSERIAGTDGTLSQRVFLPAYRTKGYVLTLWARAPGDAGRITVAVRAGGEGDGPFRPGEERAGTTVVQTDIAVSGTAWQKHTVHWQIPQGALAKGEAARFVVSGAAGGAVDVDQISLFPDDNIDGMDPDVLGLAKAWNIPVLRLAGNYSSGYHWRDGVGPREARPTNRNIAWGGVDSHAFGTDEFLDLARHIGAVPQIGVNAGSGTPEEAAAWVRYCLGKTPRVPIWEIGNELYGGWQIGHTDAPGNALRFVAFRDAMLRADPGIKIIATGKGDEFTGDGPEHDRNWNEALLRAAVADGGQAPDWLSIHPLVAMPGVIGGPGVPYAQQWESAMAHPAWLDQTLLPQLIQQIQAVEGPAARTRIAPTEWGIILGGDGWERGPNHNAEAGAVFNALTLNTFLRNGDWVTLANMTALLHGGGIKKSHGVSYVDPLYYTQKLYADAAPRIPVETASDGPGRDVPSRGGLPAASDVPEVDVFSALTADRTRLTAFLVNRSLTDARPVRLNLSGFHTGRVTATILSSADPQAGNAWDHPDMVRPKPFPLPAGANWNFTVPAHSLVVLTAVRATSVKPSKAHRAV